MPREDIEPLEPGHWLQRIEQLAARPLADEPEIERVLRHAFHLVQLAPRPLRHVIHCSCDEAEFEALLDARAFEAATLRLMGNRTGYSLNAPGGGALATAHVWYSDRQFRHSASEQSPAAALLRAWLGCQCAMSRGDDGWIRTASAHFAGQSITEH